MSAETRRALADALHTHAFAIVEDARGAAQATDYLLAQIDRELLYRSVVTVQRQALEEIRAAIAPGSYVLGSRGDDAA